MGITADGFFDWAIRDPGPPWKVNGGRNGGRGIIPHSAEGYWPHLRDILWGPRRASWHASFLRDGRVFQHYSIWAQCWTSGSDYPNNNFFAGETEGAGGVPSIPYQPWTPQQTAGWIRAGRDLRAVQGWEARRPTSPTDRGASCYEHAECILFGSDATSCPNGRNEWGIIVPAINEGGSMVDVTRVEFERLKGDVQQVFGHSLENRKLIVALGHGLTAVAKTVGTDQAEIDALEASMAEAETDILNLTKLLLALKDQEGG